MLGTVEANIGNVLLPPPTTSALCLLDTRHPHDAATITNVAFLNAHQALRQVVFIDSFTKHQFYRRDIS